jgi:Uma2 family endonuclease
MIGRVEGRTTKSERTHEPAMEAKIPAVGERFRWTRRRYEALVAAGVLGPDDRVELIAGELVAMSPQGSQHYTRLHLLADALRAAYAGADAHVRIQGPLALDPDSEPEPDLAVVPGAPRAYLDAHPTEALLVVEVADTSLAKDRLEKTALYAAHGLPVYWLLDVTGRTLTVYREPAEGAYRASATFGPNAAVRPPGSPAPVRLSDVFA